MKPALTRIQKIARLCVALQDAMTGWEHTYSVKRRKVHITYWDFEAHKLVTEPWLRDDVALQDLINDLEPAYLKLLKKQEKQRKREERLLKLYS